MVGERGSVASLGDQLIWHLQGFHVHEFVSAVGFLFPWHRTVPVMSSHIKHSINFYYDWTVLWLEQHCSAWKFFRHIIITFCRFANNDITQSPYCGYDLLQITKCYYMEISFHTTAARGLLSRVALITRMGTWAISGPGTAPGWP